jgi:predicted small lipoprotein YifL
LYGAARIGDFVVNSNYRPGYRGWAVILLSVVALSLGGCGRKAGLDLPPNAQARSDAVGQADPDAERAAQPSVFNPTYGSDASQAAPKGPKRPFILDPILGN